MTTDIFITDDHHPDIRFPAEPILAKMPQERVREIGAKRVQLMINNGIKMADADRMAINLGYHPYEIWGDQFYKIEPNPHLLSAAQEILHFLKTNGPCSSVLLYKGKILNAPENNIRKAVRILSENGYISKYQSNQKSAVYIRFEKDLES